MNRDFPQPFPNGPQAKAQIKTTTNKCQCRKSPLGFYKDDRTSLLHSGIVCAPNPLGSVISVRLQALSDYRGIEPQQSDELHPIPSNPMALRMDTRPRTRHVDGLEPLLARVISFANGPPYSVQDVVETSVTTMNIDWKQSPQLEVTSQTSVRFHPCVPRPDSGGLPIRLACHRSSQTSH